MAPPLCLWVRSASRFRMLSPAASAPTQGRIGAPAIRADCKAASTFAAAATRSRLLAIASSTSAVSFGSRKLATQWSPTTDWFAPALDQAAGISVD